MRLKFWGVRGSFPVSSPSTIRYGGNTSCIEIEVADKLIILDGGTGLYPLGKKIIAEKKYSTIHLFLTHTHLDHIAGLVNFAPLYHPDFTIYIYGPKRSHINLSDTIYRLFSNPIWPIAMDQVHAKLQWIELCNGESVPLEQGPSISALELDHPDSALGYRLDYADRALVYLTDLAHGPELHMALYNFCYNADALIYDSHFTYDEYISPKYANWGHSCWEKGVDLSIESQVKHHFIFHHSPDRTDAQLDTILENALIKRKQVYIATEQFTLDL